MANNLFTALNGVWMKKAVVSSSVKSNKMEFSSIIRCSVRLLWYASTMEEFMEKV